MLEIISDTGVYFETLPDISISMVIENPFTAEGRIPLPYSASFELPATAINLKTFGYPNRLGTYNSLNKERSVSVVIRFNSLTISKGKLILLNFDKNLKVNFSGADFNESHRAPIYSVDLGKEIIPGVFNTVSWNTVGNYAYNYRAWAASKINGSDPRFVVAPICRKSNSAEPFNWADRTRREGGELGLYRDLKRVLQEYYYNAFNVSSQNFYFSGNRTTYHAAIFPQFRVHYLLSQLIGSSLLNNPFAKGRMKDLVIPSYYHPKFLYSSGVSPMVSNAGTDYLPTSQPFVSYEDFFPNVGANDFIREVLNLFCQTLYSTLGGFTIESNTDIINRPVKHNWTDVLMDEPVILSEEGKYYEYGYQNERKVYTPEAGTVPVTVASIQVMVLQSISLDEDGMYDVIFYVSATEQYFQKVAYENAYKIGNSMIKEIVVEYNFLGYKEPILLEDSDKSKFSVKVNISTPPLHPAVYVSTLDNTGGTKNYLTVPLHEGLDDNRVSMSQGFRKREESFEILLYDGARVVTTPSGSNTTYPFLNPYGGSDVPLIWEGSAGILEKYHKPFMNWIQKDKLKLQGIFLLNSIQLHQLDVTDKIHVKGRNFYINKLQFTLYANRLSPIDAHLIEV